ncbi:serine/threonine protein phosphatase [filamentous cyanobacterium CCP5]|nr:serine/threonine protein phosphatase [filamentous cyanobacterium CCP5]
MSDLESSPTRQQLYLWAVGEGVAAKSPNQLIEGRYRVVAPHIWIDTQPEKRPPFPDELPAAAVPYLSAHPHRLHVPGLQGVIGQSAANSILLLENAPLHPRSGELFPAITDLWIDASPLQQSQWLWQIWSLWSALQPLGVASSLLDLPNLRIEGWRLRLRELALDTTPPTLSDLAAAWQPLAQDASPRLRWWYPPGTEGPSHLLDLLVDLNNPAQAESFGDRLNQLVLQQATSLRVRITTAGGTDAGPDLPRNEDACFPDGTAAPDLSPRLAIVCDGVGGHSGGDLASNLAVQSLQLQLKGLLSEAFSQSELLPPAIVTEQIEAVLRIVNDVINYQNDAQGRVGRQRMGTTIAMAVVVPQSLQTEQGWVQVEEVYIAHVGDSRAYWITPDYCHLLTVDDDIAGREVSSGRQPLPLAKERPDAGALTQALGTRSAEHLQPHIQRFILVETGVLLLCSDGLSDNNRVEEGWANYIGLMVKSIVSLEASVATWLQLANQKNGHDNSSVVLMFAQTSQKPTGRELATQADLLQSSLTPSAEALLYGEQRLEDSPVSAAPSRRRPPLWVWGVAVVIILAGMLGGWWLLRSLDFGESDPEAPTPSLTPES